jgi:hypothetical protein
MIRPPIIGAELWSRVMSAADFKCECFGSCGSKHTPTGKRTPGKTHVCDRRAVPGAPPLVIAPADPTVPPVVAAALPASDLRAWCPRCFGGAVAVARREARAQPAQVESLFDDQPAQTVICASELCPRDCVCAVDLPDGTHVDLPERPEVLAARTLPEQHVTVVAFLDRDAEELPEAATVTVVRRGAA